VRLLDFLFYPTPQAGEKLSSPYLPAVGGILFHPVLRS
jgi:hypothetical protein